MGRCISKVKTIKSEFYLLVIKIFLYTFISTIIAYIFLMIFIIYSSNYSKSTDHYEKYLDSIENEIINNTDSILEGNLIDLNEYSNKIKGEVVDINGKHLFGDIDIIDSKVDILKYLKFNSVKDGYVYRGVPLIKDDSIKYIYILKAPFSYTVNNIKDNPYVVIVYYILLSSPIIFFIVYLFLFTRKLYKSIQKNICILIEASNNISNGNFSFKINRLNGKEFLTIQESFNIMVDELKKNIEGLSKVENERQMMISSISHDIRTPITVISGEIELINDLKDMEGFSISNSMAIIKKNCDKMINLTNNLSLIYKVENLDFLFRVQRVDLDKFLKEKRMELLSLITKKDLIIKFNVNLNKKYYILDESMLNRVIDNILFNSIRFTDSGSITLNVFDEEVSDKIYFKCIDTGKGFKDSDINTLFDAFYQNKSDKNHFGLGLYISKKIVLNYSGEIKAYNNEFNGATVEFYIRELKE